MKNSINYNFYLPSSEDDDIVDVNQISENFSKIDKEMSEMLKGKGVDQTYNPESENAQSGKAVAEAIEKLNEDFLNVLGTGYVNQEQFNYSIGKTTKDYIDNLIGDISTALDELHTYAQSLVTGGATE